MNYEELATKESIEYIAKTLAKKTGVAYGDELIADVGMAIFNRRASIEKSETLGAAINIIELGIKQIKESEDREIRMAREGEDDKRPRWFYVDDFENHVDDEKTASSFWETCIENSTQMNEDHLVIGSRSNWSYKIAKMERECWSIDKVEWLVTMMLGKNPLKAKSVRTARRYRQLIDTIHDVTNKASKHGNRLVMFKMIMGGKIVLDPDHKWNGKSGELAARDMEWFFTQCKKANYWRELFNRARSNGGEVAGWRFNLNRRWNDSMARLAEEEQAFILAYCNYEAQITSIEELQLLEKVLHDVDHGELLKCVKTPLRFDDFKDENILMRSKEEGFMDCDFDALVS